MTVDYLNAPSTIYGDVNLYAVKDISRYVYSFSISNYPTKSIIITPTVLYVNVSDKVIVSPSMFTFTSSSTSLVGSFILSGSFYSSNSYVLYLNITGPDASKYSSSQVSFNVISTTQGFTPPSLSSIRFSDDAVFVYVFFDIETNLANLPTARFVCSKILSFAKADSATCLWTNASAIRIKYDSFLTNTSYVTIGSNITVLPCNLRAKCVSGSNCSSYAVASQLTGIVQGPYYPLIPTVILSVPDTISICNNLSIDATSSHGSGGRSWASISWVITGDNAAASLLIEEFLYKFGSNIDNFISIPSHMLSSVKHLNISLTLTNFLGYSSTLSKSVYTLDASELPTIYIVGDNVVRVVSRDSIFVRVAGKISSCSNISSIYYSSELYLNDVKQTTASISNDPRVFQLSRYTLTGGHTYQVLFKASTSTSSGTTAVASASIIVSKGVVVPLISGGTWRLLPVDREIVLDASSTYDEASDTSIISYSWSCYILTSVLFGTDCSYIFEGSRVSSQISLRSNSMNVSYYYAISLTASSEDLRYGTASVYIQPVITSVTTTISTTTKLFNEDASVSIDGSIICADDAIGSWTLSNNGKELVTQTKTATRSYFSYIESSFGISYPISFPIYALQQGFTYTLRLSAYPVSNSSLVSYSEVSITINGPPSNGFVLINPSSGYALTTTFSISTQGWVTSSSNFPITYVMSYQVSTNSPELTLSSRNQVSSVSSILPAGLDANDYKITIRGTAYDVYLAANNATVNVIVSPLAIDSSEDITKYSLLLSSANTAFSSSDVDKAIQIVNVVASSVNIVDCSLANSTYCSSLNRELCEQVPNTCGSCYSGYSDVVGPYNSLCYETDISEPLTHCQTDSDCIFGACRNNSCVVASKTCPSTTNGVCSGHGSCILTDSSGQSVTTCLVTNNYCFAKCFCEDGYGGSACSYDATALSYRDTVRTQLCQAIQNISYVQDASGNLLDTLVESLRSSYSPYEVVSAAAKESCLVALQIVVDVAKEGSLTSSRFTTLSSLVRSLSSFISSGIFLESSNNTESDLASIITDDLTTGILTTLVDGESTSISDEYIQMTVQSYRVYQSSNISLAPPSISSIYGAAAQGISITSSSALSSCLSTVDGYNRIAITQYNKNPINGYTNILNPVLKFSTSSSSSSSTSRRHLAESYKNDILDDVIYYITLQYAQKQSLNFSLDWFSPSLLPIPENITTPQCSVFDDTTDSYISCKGCNVSSYSNYNVTFGCYDISLLCDTLSSEIELTPSLRNRALSSSTTVSSNLFGAFLQSVGSTLSVNPFLFSASQSSTGGVVVGALLFSIVIGSMCFVRWDRLDHDYIIYVKKDNHAMKLQEEIVRRRSSHAYKYISKSSESVPMNNWSESTKMFLNDAMRSKYLLQNYSLLNLLIRTMLMRHDYFSPFFNPSLRKRRVLRWLRLLLNFLVIIFVDTAFFSIFYPDNGYCDQKSVSDQCEASMNRAEGLSMCVWHIDSQYINGGYCKVRDPPSSYISIIILALVTILISLPILFICDILIDEFASKRPDLNAWNLSPEVWFGSSTASTKSSHPIAIAVTMKRQGTFSDKTGELDDNLDIVQDLAHRAYSDLQSVDEEVGELLLKVADYLRNTQTHYNSRDTQRLIDRRMTIRAIAHGLGMNADGSMEKLTTRQRFLYGTSWNRIANRISKSRQNAAKLARGIANFNQNEESYKNDFLIQSFVLEQLPFFKRYCVRKQYFEFHETSPDSVDPFLWLLAWTILLGQIAFFLYYIYNWTAINAGRTLSAWLQNFIIGFVQDICFVQLAKIYVIYIIGVQASKRQLKSIHHQLSYVSQRIIDAESRSIVHPLSHFHVVQYLSAACRTARKKELFHLYASQLLRSVTDGDIYACRQHRTQSFGMIATGLLLIPGLVAVFMGEGISKLVLEGMFHTILSGLIIAHIYLYQISVFLIVFIYLFVLSVILYIYCMFKPLMHRRKRLIVNELIRGQDDRDRSYFTVFMDHLAAFLAFLSLRHIKEMRRLNQVKCDQWLQMNALSQDQEQNHETFTSMNLKFKSIQSNQSNQITGSDRLEQKDVDDASLISSNSSGFYSLMGNIVIPSDIQSLRIEVSYIVPPKIDWYVLFAHRLIPESLLEYLNPHLKYFKNDLIVYGNPSESLLATSYRNNHSKTISCIEALRQLFLQLIRIDSSRCSPKMQLNISYIDSIERLKIYNGHHSIDDYFFVVDNLLSEIRILNESITEAEREEILYSFIEYVDTMLPYQSDQCSFVDFTAWFVDMYESVRKLKIYLKSSTIFMPSNMVIERNRYNKSIKRYSQFSSFQGSYRETALNDGDPDDKSSFDDVTFDIYSFSNVFDFAMKRDHLK